MKEETTTKKDTRKNIFDLARELSILVDDLDRKKGSQKQIHKNT